MQAPQYSHPLTHTHLYTLKPVGSLKLNCQKSQAASKAGILPFGGDLAFSGGHLPSPGFRSIALELFLLPVDQVLIWKVRRKSKGPLNHC